MAEVKFKFVGDDSELRKKLANLSKIQSEMTDKFSKDLNEALSNSKSQVFKDITKDAANAAIQTERLNKIAANKAIVNAKLEQIDSIRRLREERSKEVSNLITLKQIESEARTVLAEKKLITESLIQSEKALHNEYLKSGKDLNAYTLKLKEQAEERRKANQEEKDAEKALRASEKARKDAEREAAKQAKETEKRKKQLEQESSEYYKLNKALGAVRKEAKDVLAEMFRMERQGHANTLGYEALRKKSEGLTRQTQLLDQGIKKIDASLGLHQRNVGNYGSAIELLGPQFESINQKLSLFGTSIDDLASKPNSFKELGTAVAGLGKQLWALVMTPVGAFVAALGSIFALFQSNKQTVIDFNAGLRDVSKTTGIAGNDLNDFGDAIIDLSMKLKVIDASKLLEYATIAGQLGIKGRADILAFTEALAMLETASDISGEEGGREIARMLTLVDGGVQNVKQFGDEIVNLGNNFAATEKEILSNAEQIAQNVGIYKIGRQDVLAFATATKAVGLEAELVGSTFSRTLGEFEKTIRSGKGVADLLKVIGGTSAELSKRFRDDAAGVFVDYVRGLNEINKSGGSVNEALERTGIIAVRDQRVIASLATNGYDVLTDALEKVTTAQGAMQAEFENGAGKLEQQSKRMGIAWDNFVLSIENGEGAIGRSVVAITGFFANLLDQINKTFNPTSIDEFLARLTSFEKADKIRELNIAFDTGSKSLNSLTNTIPNSSNINNLLKETESSIKIISEAYNKYKDDVNKGILTESGKASLKDYENLLNNLASKQYQLKLLGAGNDTNASPVKTFEETESEKRKREADQKAAERKAEHARRAVERQRKLQSDIESLANQSTRKQLSRDEAEIASIKDKYAKMREEVRKFYADPKNAGLKIDQGKLQNAESFEISEATTRQGTTALIKQLNEQKSIYDQYNAYVEQNGIDAAERMFGEQADLAKDYRDKLQREYLAIASLQKSAALAPFTGVNIKLTQAQEERAKELKQMLDALEKEDAAKARARYSEALQLAKTFTQKEFEIRKRHNEALSALGQEATDDQRKRLEQALLEDLATLVESEPEFKKAIENINTASQGMLVNAFKTGKATMLSLIDGLESASSGEKDSLRKLFSKFFDDGIKDAELGNLENIGSLISNFDQLVSTSFEFAGNIGNGVDAIRDMLSISGQLVNVLGSLSKNESFSKLAGKIAGSLGIVGAFGGILSSVTTFFAQKRTQEDQQRTAAADNATKTQLRATEAITRALEKQVELMNEIYGAERLDKYNSTLKEIEGTWKQVNSQLSGKYMLSGDAKIDEIITKMNNGMTRSEIAKGVSPMSKEMTFIYETFAKIEKGTYGIFKPLSGDLAKAKEQLIQLERQSYGKADENTQNIINQLREQIDLYEKTLNKLAEEKTGNAFSSLLSDVTNLFFNEGENSAEAWSKGFDKILENYLMQKFSREFLQERMQGWYNMMNEFAGDGIDASEREQLKKEWDAIQKAGEDRLNQMKDILNINGSTDKNNTTLKGKISRELTEKTGGEIVGIFRAGYDIWKQQLIAIQAQSSTSVNLLAIASDKLAVLNSININTANTVTELRSAVTELKAINKNTSKTGRSAEGMGL